jgi:hypothetical protein
VELVLLTSNVSHRITLSFVGRQVQQYLEYMTKLVFPRLGLLWELIYALVTWRQCQYPPPVNSLVGS